MKLKKQLEQRKMSLPFLEYCLEFPYMPQAGDYCSQKKTILA